MASKSLFTIDKSTCKRDHFCVHTCPFGIVRTDGEGYPEVNAEAESQCINCGHCMAVCPHGAFSLAAMPRETCEKIVEPLPVPADQALQLLKRRRSIRRYKPAAVPRPVLAEVLDVARWAPTAKNVQPVHYLVIESPQEVKRLAGMTIAWMRQTNLLPGLVSAWDKGMDGVLRGAPHLVIAHAPVQGFCPLVDCTIGLTSVELAANARGLGACWAGLFMMGLDGHKPLLDALHLPASHKAYGALMLGYPRMRYHLVPQRNQAQVTWRG
jgi:nitroreductase/NAD-dependent dihydropyrimidine dehydrogenase PreA subunit